jgi:hypothetical protein
MRTRAVAELLPKPLSATHSIGASSNDAASAQRAD